MSWLFDAADALGAALEGACGLKAQVGIPDSIAPGTCGVLMSETPVEYSLAESGGVADATATLTLWSCRGVTGSRRGDRASIEAASADMDALKAALEADMTLGGSVAMARLASVTVHAGRGGDNRYEATAVAKVEVSQW